MSKVTPLTALRAEDYPSEYRNFLSRLFTTLNPFLLSATNAINGNVEFGVNIPAQDVSLSFTYDGVSQQRFTWLRERQPAVLFVGQCTENQRPVILDVSWSFDATTNQVTIDQIVRLSTTGVTGLTVGNTYRIFVRAVS